VRSLFEELFAKADVPQVKCVVENLANIVVESSSKGKNMQKSVEFLLTYSKMIEATVVVVNHPFSPIKSESSSGPLVTSLTKTGPKSLIVENTKSEMYQLFSFLRIYNRLLGSLEISKRINSPNT
jgi:hypothetical protein